LDCFAAALLAMTRYHLIGLAALEIAAQLRAAQVAADEYEPRTARLAVAPWADVIAIRHHVHGLEGEAAVLARVVQDALRAQQVLPPGREQAGDPGVELFRIDRPLQLQADAGDVA